VNNNSITHSLDLLPQLVYGQRENIFIGPSVIKWHQSAYYSKYQYYIPEEIGANHQGVPNYQSDHFTKVTHDTHADTPKTLQEDLAVHFTVYQSTAS